MMKHMRVLYAGVVLAIFSLGLTSSEKATLIRKYSAAQKAELSALGHAASLQLKQLEVAQKSSLKEWEEVQRKQRHEFLEANKGGVVRRTYIQAFLKAREEKIQNHKKEWKALQKKNRDIKNLIQKKFESEMEEFRGQLELGVDPTAEFMERLKRILSEVNPQVVLEISEPQHSP